MSVVRSSHRRLLMLYAPPASSYDLVSVFAGRQAPRRYPPLHPAHLQVTHPPWHPAPNALPQSHNGRTDPRDRSDKTTTNSTIWKPYPTDHQCISGHDSSEGQDRTDGGGTGRTGLFIRRPARMRDTRVFIWSQFARIRATRRIDTDIRRTWGSVSPGTLHWLAVQEGRQAGMGTRSCWRPTAAATGRLDL